MERELEDFRSQWIQEVNENATTSKGNRSATVDENSPPEAQAVQLFRLAVDKERGGKVYDAVTFYKRAFALDPSVETKVAQLDRKQQQQQQQQQQKKPLPISTSNKTSRTKLTINNRSDSNLRKLEADDLVTDADILANLLSLGNDVVADENHFICERAVAGDDTAVHFSQLPLDVIRHVLGYAVSSELDFYTLERVSQISRAFYRLAREDSVWHAGCSRVWGNVDVCGNSNLNWREHFLSTPRVRFQGVYMSRVTYLRAGETSQFVDKKSSSYRPWQDVTFYRYLRFHGDGSCVMVCCGDEPSTIVERIKPKVPAKSPEILLGWYRLVLPTTAADVSNCAESSDEPSVIVVLHRREFVDIKRQKERQQRKRYFNTKTTYENFAYSDQLMLELSINNMITGGAGSTRHSKTSTKLEWREYNIERNYDSGKKSKYAVPLNPSQFPPLIFSRVKSYSNFDRTASHVKSVYAY